MKKRILIAPLNWGLGHATRCIPIINALLKYNFEPIIASDGAALTILRKEFPHLEIIELPSYKITYPKSGSLSWHFLKKTPDFLRTIRKENKLIQSIIITKKIDGIISDNRFGVFNINVPSVYITHQLNVLSGSTSWLSTRFHRRIINKFDECWVPDNKHSQLSGELSNKKNIKAVTKYIGALSRFKRQEVDLKYKLLILLSGPEPQRSILENKLLDQLNSFNGKIVFVRGVIENEQTQSIKGNIIIYNYMASSELEKIICQSECILSRSGYSTIMDLAKLNKRAFFIPTPGQYEQEYLAHYLNDLKIAPFSTQKDFIAEKLKKQEDYVGFNHFEFENLPKALFSLFEGK